VPATCATSSRAGVPGHRPACAILYGGSVKPDNAGALAEEPEIDGSLVGGASLNAQSFLAIVENSARAGGAVKGD
jgi:triosephosphate isomerase